MKLKEADARGVSEAEQFFLGLVKERQMSTFLPNAWALSPDELRVIFNLARVALRSAESPGGEAPVGEPRATAPPTAGDRKPGVSPGKSESRRLPRSAPRRPG